MAPKTPPSASKKRTPSKTGGGGGGASKTGGTPPAARTGRTPAKSTGKRLNFDVGANDDDDETSYEEGKTSSSSNFGLSKWLMMVAIVGAVMAAGYVAYPQWTSHRRGTSEAKNTTATNSNEPPRPTTRKEWETRESNDDELKVQDAPTLTPSPEIARGFPGSMQYQLYEGPTPPTTFTVVNDNGKEAIEIFWNGRIVALAAPGSRAKLESWIGHEFTVGGERVVLDGSFSALIFDPVHPGALRREKTVPKPVIPPFNPSVYPKRASMAKAIKIRNLSNRRLNEYWVPDEPGAEIAYQGVIEPHAEATTNSYLTHRFRFVDIKTKKKVYEFRVNEDDEIYAYVDETTANEGQLKRHLEEIVFAKDYKARTGRAWYSYYPHEPVKTFMWPADYIGQKHKVVTDTFPGEQNRTLELEVISVMPRAFLIRGLLTSEEASEVVKQAGGSLAPSSVTMHDEKGNRVASSTRTSRNSWVSRGVSPIVDRLFKRAAHVLKVNDTVLHHAPPDGVVENMQVVHYSSSAHYAPHHDWGVHGNPHTRLITLLFYLNDKASPDAGGDTAFPKAVVPDPYGIKIHPGAGNAVLFYSQYPDGNVDDYSLHEATPVRKGEKWLSNFWVHDAAHWGKTKE